MLRLLKFSREVSCSFFGGVEELWLTQRLRQAIRGTVEAFCGGGGIHGRPPFVCREKLKEEALRLSNPCVPTTRKHRAAGSRFGPWRAPEDCLHS
jgi:hypothetical protein